MDCIFCKIAAGEIPCTKLFENDEVLAFADLDPQAPFHALFIPKSHIASAVLINTENSGVISDIYEAIALVAKENMLDNGFRVVTNCGEDGGQTIGHLHFHVLAGRSLAWPPG